MNEYYINETDKIVPLPAVIEMLNIIYDYSENCDDDPAEWMEDRTHQSLDKLYKILTGDLMKEDLEPSFQRLGKLLGVKNREAYQAFYHGRYPS